MGSERPRRRWLTLASLSWALLSLGFLSGVAQRADFSPDEPLRRLSFGSCNDQKKDQAIWEPIVAGNPDVWLWLGDNIYTDTKQSSFPKVFSTASIEEMRAMYARQKAQPGYVALRQRVGKIVGTWDDHDYGLDDAGKELAWKDESQELFMDFFDIPRDSALRKRKGVYSAHVFGPPGKRVKLLILDTRYHRDPIFSNGDVLGEEQWRWLEEELVTSDAQVNIIASSIQFLPNHHATLCPLCYIKNSPFKVETWCHFARERQRLVDLINRHRVSGVLMLSGDVHLGEMLESYPACLLPYSLHELTSSGMTHAAATSYPPMTLEIMKRVSPNPFSLGMVLDKNYGQLDFEWEGRPKVTLSLRGVEGMAALEREVFLDTLAYPSEGEEGEEIPSKAAHCVPEADFHWMKRCRFVIVIALIVSVQVLAVIALLRYCVLSLLSLRRKQKKV